MLVLVLRHLCCVVNHGLVTLVVIMILKDTATFQVLFIVSLFCAWNIICSRVAFTYLKVKYAKSLCLLPVVLILVLRILSCLLKLQVFCHVTGFMSDFLSFIVVEHIRFFHGALQL